MQTENKKSFEMPPNGRMLIFLSMSIIIFIFAEGRISNKEIQLLLFKIDFNHYWPVYTGFILMFFWYWYRLYVLNRLDFKNLFENDVNEYVDDYNHCGKIEKSYIFKHIKKTRFTDSSKNLNHNLESCRISYKCGCKEVDTNFTFEGNLKFSEPNSNFLITEALDIDKISSHKELCENPTVKKQHRSSTSRNDANPSNQVGYSFRSPLSLFSNDFSHVFRIYSTVLFKNPTFSTYMFPHVIAGLSTVVIFIKILLLLTS